MGTRIQSLTEVGHGKAARFLEAKTYQDNLGELEANGYFFLGGFWVMKAGRRRFMDVWMGGCFVWTILFCGGKVWEGKKFRGCLHPSNKVPSKIENRRETCSSLEIPMTFWVPKTKHPKWGALSLSQNFPLSPMELTLWEKVGVDGGEDFQKFTSLGWRIEKLDENQGLSGSNLLGPPCHGGETTIGWSKNAEVERKIGAWWSYTLQVRDVSIIGWWWILMYNMYEYYSTPVPLRYKVWHFVHRRGEWYTSSSGFTTVFTTQWGLGTWSLVLVVCHCNNLALAEQTKYWGHAVK